MEEERKKREAQDHMEKLKIKKELAQKAAEVSNHGVNCLWRVSYAVEKEGSLWFSPAFMVAIEYFRL